MSKMKRKVLIIAYRFPPAGGGGVQRTLKFVKYLPLFGWEPVVLTVKPWGLELRDDTMLQEIPKDIKIYRTFALDPIKIHQLFKQMQQKKDNLCSAIHDKESSKRDPLRAIKDIIHLVSIPDTEVGWFPFAVLRGKKIIDTENIDCIYSTSGPYTCHLVALCLKQWTNSPWVADFRDPWTQHQFASYRFKTRLKIEENMELRILKTADRVVTVTKPFADGFSHKYHQVSRDKFNVITNGYDANDFSSILSVSQRSHKFTIVHTGSFFALRTPKYFLKALRLLLDETPLLKEDIEVVFAGRLEASDKRIIHDLGLEDVVKLMCYVSHQEAISLLSNSDMILLILANTESSVYPGKIFEYMAIGKPVLTLAPTDGIAAALIRKTKTGVVVNSEDVTAIKNEIRKMYEQYKEGILAINPDLSIIRQYERKALTKDLAVILNEVVTDSLS